MATRTKRNIWRSKRLIFRPVETTDEAFLLSFNAEFSDGFQNAAPLLPVPQGTAGAKSWREHLEKCMVGAVICLPPVVTTPETTPATPSPPTPATAPPPNQPIPIGTISLNAVEPGFAHHRNTSIGINLAASYQGQGYGSEAILWALEWAFRHANMHRVAIGAFAWNEGAWKLYERLGFVIEGRVREAMWYDGAYRDLVELGMLRREWEGRYGVRREE